MFSVYSSVEKVICKNCGEEFEGNYCNYCGQRWIKKINWVFIIENLGNTFEFKKGVLYNLKNFTFNPQKAISEYLNGRTKPFLNPVSYTFLGLALFFISIRLTGMVGNDAFDEEIFNKAETIVYSTTILFPFLLSLILNFSIIDKKPNYIHGLIVALFLAGHILILLAVGRSILFSLNQLIPLDRSLGLYLVATILLWFSIAFAKGYIKLGYLLVLLRLFGSTLTFLITSFIVIVILYSLGVISPSYGAGYDVGKLSAKIYQLFIGY